MMEEDQGCLSEPDQQDMDFPVPEDPQESPERLLPEEEEGVAVYLCEVTEDVTGDDASAETDPPTLPSMTLSISDPAEMSHIFSADELYCQRPSLDVDLADPQLSGSYSYPLDPEEQDVSNGHCASSTTCLDFSSGPYKGCTEELSVTKSQEEDSPASGCPKDGELVVPPAETQAGELDEAAETGQEEGTPSLGASEYAAGIQSPGLTDAMQDQLSPTDSQSEQESGASDSHAEDIEPTELTGLGALKTPVCPTDTDSEVGLVHERPVTVELDKGDTYPIGAVEMPPEEIASFAMEEEEGREISAILQHNEEMKKEEEEEEEEDEQSEQTDQSEQSTESQLKRREQAEQEEQIKQSKEREELEQIEPLEQLEQTQKIEQSEQTEQMEQSELEDQRQQSEQAQQREQSEQTDSLEQSELTQQREQPEQTEPLEQSELTQQMEQPEQTEEAGELKQTEQSVQTGSVDLADNSPPEVKGGLDTAGHIEQTLQPVALQQTEDQTEHKEPSVLHTNGECVDREGACRLAERLYRLQDMRRADVVKHLNKDNEFSQVVGEEYLKFFDFTGQSLDQALRSFLKVVVLIGETQERERVLEHFSRRFHQCNPNSFSSTGAVLTLTCAVMLLNTDLHGQNVGKAMSMSGFVSNLDGMNEGGNFRRELLKGLYSAIKNEPLEWAIDEEELKSSMVLPGDDKADTNLRSKSNPFQDVPHDKKATVYKQGFLTRKAHADIDGKRTPWGKRSWKTFYAVLKGMVLYLQKDEYRIEWQSSVEVISVHHALAERAEDYTKRPHVFRLQTADWRVFLFQAATAEQMSSWICRINLVSALYSSPPFPAAVGSQKRFSRPILPASQSALTLEKQLQSHGRMLDSFSGDLALLLQAPAEGRKFKAREVEERRLREEYLLHEKSRYEVYKQMLEVWQGLGGHVGGPVGTAELERFDGELCMEIGDMQEEAALKKSHSSPSLNLESPPPPVVKVRRNISERRTYRKIIIPRRNREV